MIILNITYKVAHSILEDWLLWQKEHHIPEIMATDLFTSHNMFRLLNHDDEEGVTFIIQFNTTEPAYNRFVTDFDEQFKQASYTKWGCQFIAFRTILAPVN